MAYTTIDKPDLYFNTVLYTGNGSTQSISGVNFRPDLVWIKGRSVVAGHNLHDVVRGVNKQLYTNTSDAEETLTTLVTSFDSDGFSLGSNGNANSNTNTFVAWNWLANNTSGSSNTDGSITSTVSANTTSGFSIVSYTGTGSLATVGHGLGIAPSFIFGINRTSGGNWFGYHKSLSATQNIQLNQNSASSTNSTFYNNTEPTSSVFTINTNSDINTSSNNFIAYCFAEKKGFSKFGSFIGNGSNDGVFCFTGMKPSFVMVKESSGTSNWLMFDNKRDISNGVDAYVKANASDSENSGTDYMDFLSNGFKCRNAQTFFNESGSTYIYMAFAENPFVTSTAIPCTAR